MISAPDYAELAAILKRIGHTEAPSHFHGALCGSLCVVESDHFEVASLIEDVEAADAESCDLLEKLRDVCESDLCSADMCFQPLLPADAAPLPRRVEALSDWCGGFLLGLSSQHKLDLDALSDQARETLADFAEFTRAGFDPEGDPEAEEAAFTELVEYVRVGAQLLFLELHPRPPAGTDPSMRLH